MNIIIALFGKSASGKDSIQNFICKNYKNTHKIISYTTRPPRINEVDGKDYFFISQESFLNKTFENKMLETTVFNEWLYGTSIEQLEKNKINIGVFNILGVYNLLTNKSSILKDYKIYPIMINCPDCTRILRSLTRDNSDCLEICRRFIADENDFKNIPFEYETVTNSNENDIEDVCGKIMGIINYNN